MDIPFQHLALYPYTDPHMRVEAFRVDGHLLEMPRGGLIVGRVPMVQTAFNIAHLSWKRWGNPRQHNLTRTGYLLNKRRNMALMEALYYDWLRKWMHPTNDGGHDFLLPTPVRVPPGGRIDVIFGGSFGVLCPVVDPHDFMQYAKKQDDCFRQVVSHYSTGETHVREPHNPPVP